MLEVVRHLRASPWILSIAVAGVVVHILAFLLLKVAPARGTDIEFTAAYVSYGGPADESVLLYDPEPLYLPTAYNASSAFEPEPSNAPEAPLFDLYAPRTSIDEERLAVRAGKAGSEADTLADSFEPAQWSLLSEFGRTRKQRTALPERWAAMRVFPMTGEPVADSVVHSGTLPDPAPEFATGQLWRPAVYLVLVEAGGLAMLPLPQEQTGIDALDRYFRQYLMQPGMFSQLAPGYYRVVLGP